MKKHLITLCVASGLAITGTAVATAADGDVTVSNEQPGLNCTYGGVRIDVQHGNKDVKQMNKPKQPDPADGVFFVCNGAPGTNGSTGPTGPQGPKGEPGDPGTTPVARKCTTSVRQYARIDLPKQLRGSAKVRLMIQGPNTTNVRFDKNVLVRTQANGSRPHILVPLRNRNCGDYIVTVSKPGSSVKPLTKVLTITGLYGLRQKLIY